MSYNNVPDSSYQSMGGQASYDAAPTPFGNQNFGAPVGQPGQPMGPGRPIVGQPQMGVSGGPIRANQLGMHPKKVTCPCCHRQGVTIVTRKLSSSGMTLLIILLILVGFFALFVLCCDEKHDYTHTCCHCRRPVGIYRPEP
jgi:hypothetical protein